MKRFAVYAWYLMDMKARVTHAKKVVTHMTGNTVYPTPDVPLASITTAADELVVAITNADGGTVMDTAIMHQKSEVLVDLVRNQCKYVNRTANGNEVDLLSSGYDLNKVRTNFARLPKPQNVRQVLTKDSKGVVIRGIVVRWDKVDGSRSYNVFRAPYSPGLPYPTDADFEPVATVTKARCILNTGMRTGQTFLIKVAAVNGFGQGEMSDPCETVVI
jgi:hypothetical protein